MNEQFKSMNATESYSFVQSDYINEIKVHTLCETVSSMTVNQAKCTLHGALVYTNFATVL